MAVSHRFLGAPGPCSYLPGRVARMEYEFVEAISADESTARLDAGWRRFGRMGFRPRCRGCDECRPLRIVVDRFEPSRSQRRAWSRNLGEVELRIGPPRVGRDRLDLHRRYHEHQAEAKGWPAHEDDAAAYAEAFVDNPRPIEEWTYWLGPALVGVGFVDALPGCLSAIYFFHEPGLARRSLGTFNVLSIIESARARGLPHAYLGYYVAGCPSLSYKGRFGPSEILDPAGRWVEFRADAPPGLDPSADPIDP